MRAIAVFLETIADEATFADYRARVIPTLQPFGGVFLVRGGAFSLLEGRMPCERVVLVEFPSRDAAEGWYASAAYRAILPLRLASARGDAFIVDAVS
ncbi:MAG: DUF1330 domain-containing protein [Paracoccaceae bacterium]